MTPEVSDRFQNRQRVCPWEFRELGCFSRFDTIVLTLRLTVSIHWVRPAWLRPDATWRGGLHASKLPRYRTLWSDPVPSGDVSSDSAHHERDTISVYILIETPSAMT